MQSSCKLCQKKTELSIALGICPSCLSELSLEQSKDYLAFIHSTYRTLFPLPKTFPIGHNSPIICNVCSANCFIGINEIGWCGLRQNKNGKMFHLTSKKEGLVSYYLDPHITNCCNAWFCPASTGTGYPRYAVNPKCEKGYYNLALFLYGCSYNCLFCQNWEHKNITQAPKVTSKELIAYTMKNKNITCWCWFGGSPEPQLPFVLYTSTRVRECISKDRVLRICFEWNGDVRKSLVKKAGLIALESGGNIKFDFKAWNPSVHYALTGRTNEQMKENLLFLHTLFQEFNADHLFHLGVTTLLVPYYVGKEEVEQIAKFLGSLDNEIPYSLLVFHPAFKMKDLPITPLKQVIESYLIAKKYLENVTIGNLHLLGYSSLNEFLEKNVWFSSF